MGLALHGPRSAPVLSLLLAGSVNVWDPKDCERLLVAADRKLRVVLQMDNCN